MARFIQNTALMEFFFKKKDYLPRHYRVSIHDLSVPWMRRGWLIRSVHLQAHRHIGEQRNDLPLFQKPVTDQLCQAPVVNSGAYYGKIPPFLISSMIPCGIIQPHQVGFEFPGAVPDGSIHAFVEGILVGLDGQDRTPQERADECTDPHIRAYAFLLVKCFYLDTPSGETDNEPARIHPFLTKNTGITGTEFLENQLLGGTVIINTPDFFGNDPVTDKGDFLLVFLIKNKPVVCNTGKAPFNQG